MASNIAKKLFPGFETNLATLLVGVDTLCGGNIAGSATDRFILDTWSSEKEFPPIYDDKHAETLRLKGGASPETKDTVRTFVATYALPDLPAQVRRDAEDFAPERRAYVNNLCGALDVILRTMVALADGTELPSFDERRAASLLAPDSSLINPAPVREQLRESLDHLGYEATNGTLREQVEKWRAKRLINPSNIVQRITVIKKELVGLLQRNILSHIDLSLSDYWPRLESIPFTEHTLRITTHRDHTGFSEYNGGTSIDGIPLLRGVFEFNVDHPVTNEDLYVLVAHEVAAHHFSTVVRDLSYQCNRLPFEATLGTTCTPDTVHEEGLAETMLYLLFGSRAGAVEALGSNLATVLAVDDLQNIAKYNVGILRLREGWEPSAVRQYVAKECVQPDAIVDKMSHSWSSHPLLAPMYSPAYHYGAHIVRSMLEHHTPAAIARVGFHLDGLVDIQTFQEKLARDKITS